MLVESFGRIAGAPFSGKFIALDHIVYGPEAYFQLLGPLRRLPPHRSRVAINEALVISSMLAFP